MSVGYILRGDKESQKFIMQANLRFEDLCKYAEFTYMSDAISDPYALEIETETDQKGSEKFYQRKVDARRVGKIIAYVKSMILSKSPVDGMSLFPTALLLAAHWEAEIEMEKSQVRALDSFYEEIDSLYVVDGQHRLYSLKKLYEEVKKNQDDDSQKIKSYLEDYTFNCMILLNYDLWEQAKVFADVNFNQKSVNKSLYYSIFGMQESQTIDDLKQSNIYIAHQLTRYMNMEVSSPLYQSIKMLGTGKGYISQAFFADSLIKNMRPLGIWYIKDEDRKNYGYMAKELIDFFDVVKEVFKDIWPDENKEHKSIITKTTGIGALLWIMAQLHERYLPTALIAAMRNDYNQNVRAEYRKIIKNQLIKIYPYRKDLFAIGGKYGSSGGRGQETALRKEMISIIEKSE